MKFTVSSSELLSRLLNLSRVISNKNSMPILDYFLFNLSNGTLTITASDLETTLCASLPIEQSQADGCLAIPARILTDSLKDFPEQPITFALAPDNATIEVSWPTGRFKIPVASASEYPDSPTVEEEHLTYCLGSSVLLEGINRTLFATADEELRPVMNGIFFDIKPEGLTLVASDAHKLVCYTRPDLGADCPRGFILPKKPAHVIRNLLAKLDEVLTIRFDSKRAFIQMAEYAIIFQLVEGVYPAYRSVIPRNNTNVAIVDRQSFLGSARRAAVCASQGSMLLRLALRDNILQISAEDFTFHTSALETLSCQYNGEPMEIGFKSNFLIEILSNFPGSEITLSLADPSRAGLISPTETANTNENLLALLMPMQLLN